jgi:hypothetical protein
LSSQLLANAERWTMACGHEHDAAASSRRSVKEDVALGSSA